MFGTLTLHGVQVKNIFVADNGQELHLANSWVPIGTKIEKYILIKKFNDELWYVIRDFTVKTYD